MKKIRVILLALMLSVGMVLTPGCGSTVVPQVFQTDPIGATLKTVKDAYESSVRTAGRLYVQKLITEVQIRNFRDKAYVVYNNYNILLALHENSQLSASDARLKNLQVLSDALTALVVSFS